MTILEIASVAVGVACFVGRVIAIFWSTPPKITPDDVNRGFAPINYYGMTYLTKQTGLIFMLQHILHCYAIRII